MTPQSRNDTTTPTTLAEGVYAQLRGPHYNTAAEAEWLRRVGADLVGMSTVPEAIAAREAGLELLGLSVVTAIEGSNEATDPDEVVAAAEATGEFIRADDGIIRADDGGRSGASIDRWAVAALRFAPGEARD